MKTDSALVVALISNPDTASRNLIAGQQLTNSEDFLLSYYLLGFELKSTFSASLGVEFVIP